MQYLHTDSTLQSGKYRIIGVLGQGGFGITYLAENVMLEGKVAIKEFFFKGFCNREADTSHVTVPTESNRALVDRFKRKFIKEARTIFKLNHPNIVRILDIFEENDTAYYVMDYIEGSSLGDIVNSRGCIPEAEAAGYIKTVASALQYIHGKNINHLDIKPGNIMKRSEDGSILVIDFGVAKQYDAETAESTTTTPVGISKGYSPLEQYTLAGVREFSPQSDVYSLAATLYKLLTGITPPEAATVNDSGLPKQELQAKGVSPSVIKAIEAAMRSRSQRTQSIKSFVADLESSGTDDTIYDIEETLNTELSEAEGIKQIAMQRYLAEKRTKEEKEAAEKKAATEQAAIEARQAAIEAEIQRLKEEEERRQGIFNVNGVTFKMIKVEGGTFDMMETVRTGFLGLSSKEIVQRTTLSDYYIGETPVTQALWQAVMGSNPSKFKGSNRPVECVSWDDCQTFITMLNSITGKRFRLPTEAEWEFAARGGNNGRGYEYSGSNKLSNVAWYGMYNEGTTHDVATKKSNELGIYDMSGNVWEWCYDWYGNYTHQPKTDPEGLRSGTHRALRGGSWLSNASCCSVSYRGYNFPSYHSDFIGFRLVFLP